MASSSSSNSGESETSSNISKSETSVMLLKATNLVAMACDSRLSMPSGAVGNDNFVKMVRVRDDLHMCMVGSAYVFGQVCLSLTSTQTCLNAYSLGIWASSFVNTFLSNCLSRFNKRKKRHILAKRLSTLKLELYIIDRHQTVKVFCRPVPTCLWFHALELINDRVVFAGSGTTMLREFYLNAYPYGHPFYIDEDECLQFMKEAIRDSISVDWSSGGPIHIVLLSPQVCRY